MTSSHRWRRVGAGWRWWGFRRGWGAGEEAVEVVDADRECFGQGWALFGKGCAGAGFPGAYGPGIDPDLLGEAFLGEPACQPPLLKRLPPRHRYAAPPRAWIGHASPAIARTAGHGRCADRLSPVRTHWPAGRSPQNCRFVTWLPAEIDSWLLKGPGVNETPDLHVVGYSGLRAGPDHRSTR
jgi:hypothetical protein